MFIWFDKDTLEARGLGKNESLDPKHFSFPVDQEVYLALTADIGKLRWARLVPTRGQYSLKFLMPTNVVRSVVKEVTAGGNAASATLTISISAANTLSIASDRVLPPGVNLVVCKDSVFDVKLMEPLRQGKDDVPTKMLAWKDKPDTRFFVSGVGPDWTIDLVFETT